MYSTYQFTSASGSISTFASSSVAIPGKTTEEPSVWTEPFKNPFISSRNILIGIFSSVLFPDKSTPTADTNFISGWAVKSSLKSFSECFSFGIE
ncbi:hypothetical protein J2Z42_002952 [Clostridium algifaecis]|uniref:Uncharacterized protein n=1 Tax=Clostridium algifaecis TaxID=1472040 RepID=A0ABS4KW15_9CLOT|nr:hypothetical protein [Clostridium algifaecis]